MMPARTCAVVVQGPVCEFEDLEVRVAPEPQSLH